jgi:hypothetical protein
MMTTKTAPSAPLGTVHAAFAAMLAVREIYAKISGELYPYRILCRVITGDPQPIDDLASLDADIDRLAGSPGGYGAGSRMVLEAVKACIATSVDEVAVMRLTTQARIAIGIRP